MHLSGLFEVHKLVLSVMHDRGSGSSAAGIFNIIVANGVSKVEYSICSAVSGLPRKQRKKTT